MSNITSTLFGFWNRLDETKPEQEPNPSTTSTTSIENNNNNTDNNTDNNKNNNNNHNETAVDTTKTATMVSPRSKRTSEISVQNKMSPSKKNKNAEFAGQMPQQKQQQLPLLLQKYLGLANLENKKPALSPNAAKSSTSWLGWKKDQGTSIWSLKGNGNGKGEEENIEEEHTRNDVDDEHSTFDDDEVEGTSGDDVVEDDSGDEVDDHVKDTNSGKRGLSWLWSGNNRNVTNPNHDNTGVGINTNNNNDTKNNNDTNTNNNNDTNTNNNTNNNYSNLQNTDTNSESSQNKDTSKEANKRETALVVANTIVNSTAPLPLKQELIDDNKRTPSQQKGDDAVLYKPHDKNSQFKKINTRKNEDLKENTIVPDWDGCLPAAHEGIFFHNSSTSNQNNASQTIRTDLNNWKHFLNQISTKFGFSAGTISDSTENQASKTSKVENEMGLLYEKSYKLYGKSLAILPMHKRACLPSFNKYYTEVGLPQQQSEPTQYEDDQLDPNSISVTNDAMGNILINNKGNKKRALHRALNAEIVNYKAGPLKKIKKILIIGVHGFFPTKMIRPLIGAPQGTSLKFANEAEKAVIRYCVENNLISDEKSEISIQKIALEKEGKIFDRVNFFTEILQKWEAELNNADFIFIASHSQGCVVSIILLARLIRMGILRSPIDKRIGLLGMAGINNGPFYGADKTFFMKAYSTIEHDSLNELFELTKFDSTQSVVYKESIQTIINVNVKICFIGSINDQLVPLYSALASHIFHPNIYRACYIDYSSFTPKFVEKLVSMCTNLLNLGFFDNNVIKELSTSLAGPMTAGGHSKIYNDGKVYDLGIKFFLDTDDLVIPHEETIDYDNFENSELPVSNQVYIKEYNVGKIGTNPYILPWCLRGFLFNVEKNWPDAINRAAYDDGDNDEHEYREESRGIACNRLGRNGAEEIHELYEIFEHWKPETKIYKDLKFRLNGFRASKL